VNVASALAASFSCSSVRSFFFLRAPATPEIYTLSLHDALPISGPYRWEPLNTSPWSDGDPGHGSSSIDSSTSVGACPAQNGKGTDRKSTRLNSSHVSISYAVFCLKKKKEHNQKKTM